MISTLEPLRRSPRQLHPLRTRYMDPKVARFTEMDSFSGDLKDPVGLNKYVYAADDPVLRIDPSGMDSLVEQLVITGIRATFFAWNAVNLLNDANMARLLAIKGANALRNGDRYEAGGYLFGAILAGGAAVLDFIGLLSFVKAPPTISGTVGFGALALSAGAGAGRKFYIDISINNPPVRSWILKELVLPGLVALGLREFASRPRSLLPTRGTPNTSQAEDRPGRPGEGTIRDYGPDGKALKDFDIGHDYEGAGDPHAHDWNWTGPRPVRGPARPLLPGE